jgi:hypothetical protein
VQRKPSLSQHRGLDATKQEVLNGGHVVFSHYFPRPKFPATPIKVKKIEEKKKEHLAEIQSALDPAGKFITVVKSRAVQEVTNTFYQMRHQRLGPKACVAANPNAQNKQIRGEK